MHNQAIRIEMAMKEVTAEELESLGGVLDASGVWTFRDGSRGKLSERTIAMYDDEHTKLGFSYFDSIDRIQ